MVARFTWVRIRRTATVPAGSDDREPVDPARNARERSPGLGVESRARRAGCLHLKSQDVSGESVAAGEDEFGGRGESLDVEAGQGRTFGQRSWSADGLIVATDGAGVPRRQVASEKPVHLLDQRLPDDLSGGVDHHVVFVDEGNIRVRHRSSFERSGCREHRRSTEPTRRSESARSPSARVR